MRSPMVTVRLSGSLKYSTGLAALWAMVRNKFLRHLLKPRASPGTITGAVETGWVAEACTLSLREHRPVQIEEVRIP